MGTGLPTIPLTPFLISTAILTAATIVQSQPKERTYLISRTQMGGIQLEMTLAEARRAVPKAKFERTSDGDGAALVSVTLPDGASMIVSADEDDPEAPIDWTKTIKSIETFSPAFRVAEGVRPGSLVAEVEKVFGRTKEIVQSEIESREYITFEKQPAWLKLRLNYTGIFSGDSRRTTRFHPGARIHSIAVSTFGRE